MIERDRARELYESGLSMVKIAKELNISVETIRTWRKRHKWIATKVGSILPSLETPPVANPGLTVTPQDTTEITIKISLVISSGREI